jgi:hypothetical protein
MIVLGLLILIGVAAVVVAAVVRGDDPARVDLGSFTIKTDLAGIFAAGALTLLLAVIGLWLLSKGLKRARQRRSEMRALKDRATKSEEAARRERAASPGSSTSSKVADRDSRDTRRSTDGNDDHFDTTPRER